MTGLMKKSDMLMNNIRLGLSVEKEKDVFERARRMYSDCRRQREDYEADWRELAKYFGPNLCKIDDDTKTKRSQWNNIINNTCLVAVRTLKSGMQSGLTNKSIPWFKIGLEDFELQEYGPAKEWLETCTKRMQTIFRRSNFYNVSTTIYGNAAIFGQAVQLQLFDHKDTFWFQTMLTGRYWIGQDSRRRVNRLFFQSTLNVEQLVEAYGKRCPANVLADYDKGDYFNCHKVITGIFPNPYPGWDRDGMTLIASNQKPFVSVHWIEGHELEPLKTAGYDRFPAQVPRWEPVEDEPYSIGAGIVALGDTKAMQLKEREKAKGLQLMIRPPTSAPAEMRNAQFPISGIPGGVTYRPPNTNADAIKPMYEVNLPLQYMLGDIKIDEGRVNQAFFADLFLMLHNMDRRDMTAKEVGDRGEERLMALSPTIENMSTEYLDPCIERGFEIMLNNTIDDQPLLPPPPEEIQGKTLKVEYVSMLAQAQQQVGIGGIERLLTFTGQASQLFPNSNIGDKLDLDQAVDEVSNMLGVPSRLIRTDDNAAQIRDNRAQAAQQANMAQMGMMAAKAAKDLGQAPMGEGNALEQLTGA